MPHILLSKHQDIDIYQSECFDFIAKSIYDEKIHTNLDGKEFFLTKVEKKGNHLIKLDNATRLTPVSLMKDALNIYAKESRAEVLFSNTYSMYNKVKPQEEYLKEIEYFVNDFKTDKEIWVEVGFGSGTHLLYQAKQNPDKLIIGLEIHFASIEQVLKQIKIQNITNILIINYDARLFLEFLQSNSVGRIFVHFPVPWDKKPHRRVMSKEFIEESMRVLKVGGSLELRTDSPNYFEYSSSLLKYFSTYKYDIYTNKDLEVTSKYEARWKRQEKTIWDILIYSKDESKEVELLQTFEFDKKTYDIDSIKTNIPSKAIVKNDYLVHFEALYDTYDKNEKKGLLLKVTFGSFNRPVTKYIYIVNNFIRYIQGEPIKTRTNLEAHQTILENIK